MEDSILMSGAVIGKNAIVYKSIVGTGVTIGENAVVGSMDDSADKTHVNTKICSDAITLLGADVVIGKGVKVAVNSMVTENME